MRIIVSTHDWLSPIYGGGALRTVLVARELKKRGHDVIIIGPSKTDKIDGIKIISVPAPRKVRSQILSAIKFNFRLFFKFLRYIRNCDLIFLHNTIAAPAPLFLSKVYRKKFVFDITDIHAEYLRIGYLNIFERMVRPFLLWLEYFLIRQASKVIVVTKVMARQVIKKGTSQNKVTVVYDGVDLSRFTAEKKPESEYNIIHLGTIDKQHGVHYIAMAAEKVINEFPQVHFYIVGDGREFSRVKKIVSDKKLDKYFTFTGYVDHFTVQDYLKKCSIGIIPRPYSLPNNLVITLKLPEYWGSGTVVISSRLEGIQEIATDREDVLFFEPDNPDDLAEKIVYLLKNPDLRRRLIENGWSSVQKFIWGNLIKQIADQVENKR